MCPNFWLVLYIYTIYTKVCGHPFKLVDSAISDTYLADRCITSSKSHESQRQTLALEWPYWRPQRLSTWQRHRMPPFQQVSSSNFCPDSASRSTVSAFNEKWKHLGATMAQPWLCRPHKLKEQECRVLKLVARANHLSSIAKLTTEFQTASGRNVSTRTVRRELHEMGFHGRAAAYKPKITIHNANRRLEWYNTRRHWNLLQWIRSLWNNEACFTIWQSDG